MKVVWWWLIGALVNRGGDIWDSRGFDLDTLLLQHYELRLQRALEPVYYMAKNHHGASGQGHSRHIHVLKGKALVFC